MESEKRFPDLDKVRDKYNQSHLPIDYVLSDQYLLAQSGRSYITGQVVPKDRKMTDAEILSLVDLSREEEGFADIPLVVPDRWLEQRLKSCALDHFGKKLEKIYTIAEIETEESDFDPDYPFIILIDVNLFEFSKLDSRESKTPLKYLLQIVNPASQKANFRGSRMIKYKGKSVELSKSKPFSSLCLIKNLLEDFNIYSRLDIERVLGEVRSGKELRSAESVLEKFKKNPKGLDYIVDYLEFYEYLSPDERLLNRDLGELYAFFLALMKVRKISSVSSMNLPLVLENYEHEYDNYTGNTPKVTPEMRESDLYESARLFEDLPETASLSHRIRETPEYREYKDNGNLADFKEQLPLLVMTIISQNPDEFPVLLRGGPVFQNFLEKFMEREEEK